MIRNLTVHFIKCAILLQVFHSQICLSAISGSCMTFYVPDYSKTLRWTYYFSENIPTSNYGKIQDFAQNNLSNFKFKGGVTPGALRVAYRKSTFSADPSVSPEFIVDSIDSQSHTFQETQKILNFLYLHYKKRGTVPTSTIAEMRSLDHELNPENFNYIVFSDPTTNEPKVMIRIFDASPRNDMHQSPLRKAQPLPIELEYLELTLPDRKIGNNYLIELGRLGKEDSIEGDLQALLRTIAEYLPQSFWSYWITQKSDSQNTTEPHHEPIIYVEALAPAARLYKNKYHFEEVFSPKELKIPKGQPARYILRIHAKTFIEHHQKQFETFKINNH